MIIREGAEPDVAACNEVWASTQVGLGAEPLPPQPLAAHELRTGRLVVAEIDGSIAGFGATLTRSGVLYLADLFVAPQHQSRGVGRQLTHALCGRHRGPLFTFSSADRRARLLYEQFDMRAVEPYHYLEGCVDTLRPWGTDVELFEASGAEMLALDGDLTRRDRAVDIAYASDLGVTWHLAFRRRVCVGAVATVAPTWWNPWHPRAARLGPVMAHDPADISAIVSAALSVTLSTADVTSADGVRPDVVSFFVPSGLNALPALLGAGFEIVDTDQLRASDETIIDRSRYLPLVDTP